MAENDKSKDIQNQDINTEEESKETNRTFSQSDVDKMISAEKKKVAESFDGYDDMKSQLEGLQKEKKEKQLAEASELEKKDLTINELKEKYEKTESELSQARLKILRDEVLSDSKFSKLPKAYKKLVTLSDDKDVVFKSAEDALVEYEADFGKKPDTYGTPQKEPPKNGKPAFYKDPVEMASAIKATVLKKFNT